MKIQSLRDSIAEYNENAILFDNPAFDSSILGLSIDGRVVYDLSKMVEEFSLDENVSLDDALEFIDYNTLRVLDYIDAENKPIILDTEIIL